MRDNIDIDGETYKFMIYDTVGEEKFGAYFTNYLHHVQAVVIVVDVTKSLDEINK